MASKEQKQTTTQKSQSGSTGLSKGYKSYQPATPCGNKLLQKKWDQTYFDEHRRLVKSAKPVVDTRTPATRPHITSKWKKQQIQKERSEEIDRDNINLLKKMQRIMHTEGQVDHKYTYKHHSLNEKKRHDEMDRIAKENKEMLKRLEKVEPYYKVADWIDDWRKKEELTDMITIFPDDTRIPPPSEARTRAKSSIETKHSATSRQDNDEADKKEEKEQDVVNNTEQTSGHNEINTL